LTEPLATVSGVWKRYNSRWVLRGVNLNVYRGDRIFILGANGSGKTTLLGVMAGLIQPSRGSISYSCGPPKACVGYSGHYPLLYEDLTVEENIKYYSILYGVDPRSVIGSGLWSSLSLNRVEGSKVSQLSYGWRKRVDIARATLHNPQVLLLDEPFTGLDEDASGSLADILLYLSESGVGIVMTSPRPDREYVETATRIYSLRGGVLEDGVQSG